MRDFHLFLRQKSIVKAVRFLEKIIMKIYKENFSATKFVW